ncbi:conserved hypothetical protein [Brochothrix thermosphacta]|nr:conserved hypothetical protein [Brochothrix thermosphacta]
MKYNSSRCLFDFSSFTTALLLNFIMLFKNQIALFFNNLCLNKKATYPWQSFLSVAFPLSHSVFSQKNKEVLQLLNALFC